MLSSLWWLPLAVAAASAVPIWRGARRLVEETGLLQASIADLRQLRPLVAQVKDEIAAVSAAGAGRGSGAAGAVSAAGAEGRGIRDLGPR